MRVVYEARGLGRAGSDDGSRGVELMSCLFELHAAKVPSSTAPGVAFAMHIKTLDTDALWKDILRLNKDLTLVDSEHTNSCSHISSIKYLTEFPKRPASEYPSL